MLLLDSKHQAQKVILTKSGEKEQEKAFLGYEFSTRKGNEGIKKLGDTFGGKMYDDNNHQNSQKVNSYILANFQEEYIGAIEEELSGPFTKCFSYRYVEF